MLNNYAFQSESLNTQGTVVSIKKESVIVQHASSHIPSEEKREIKYKPIISFTSEHGKLIQFTSEEYCSSCKPGDTMDIMYLPDNPEKARAKYKQPWMPAIKFAGYGVIFLIFIAMVRMGKWFINIVRQDAANS